MMKSQVNLRVGFFFLAAIVVAMFMVSSVWAEGQVGCVGTYDSTRVYDAGAQKPPGQLGGSGIEELNGIAMWPVPVEFRATASNGITYWIRTTVTPLYVTKFGSTYYMTYGGGTNCSPIYNAAKGPWGTASGQNTTLHWQPTGVAVYKNLTTKQWESPTLTGTFVNTNTGTFVGHNIPMVAGSLSPTIGGGTLY